MPAFLATQKNDLKFTGGVEFSGKLWLASRKDAMITYMEDKLQLKKPVCNPEFGEEGFCLRLSLTNKNGPGGGGGGDGGPTCEAIFLCIRTASGWVWTFNPQEPLDGGPNGDYTNTQNVSFANTQVSLSPSGSAIVPLSLGSFANPVYNQPGSQVSVFRSASNVVSYNPPAGGAPTIFSNSFPVTYPVDGNGCAINDESGQTELNAFYAFQPRVNFGYFYNVVILAGHCH